jgi:hypothetical protein
MTRIYLVHEGALKFCGKRCQAPKPTQFHANLSIQTTFFSKKVGRFTPPNPVQLNK